MISYPYPCPHCDYVADSMDSNADSKADLDRHMERKHPRHARLARRPTLEPREGRAVSGDLRARVLTELGICPFRENVNDASMCSCGLPALTHDEVAAQIVLNDHPAILALLDERDALAAKVERARAVHTQDDDFLEPGAWCPACGDTVPCATVRALGDVGAPS